MQAEHQYKRLIRKVQGVFLVGVASLTAYFITTSYMSDLAVRELSVQNHLKGVANTAARMIDGNVHEQFWLEYSKQSAISSSDLPSDYVAIQDILRIAQEENDLSSPVYTLVLDSSLMVNEKPRFLFGVTTLERPYYRHEYRNFPEDLLTNYASGGALDEYKDEHGSWISAFAPIHNAAGDVVAAVQADLPFDEFIAAARSELALDIVLAIAIATLLLFVLNKYMKRVISQQEIMKQLSDSLDEAREARERAEKASRAKAEFLSNMSHEIRTPLNAVVGLSHHLMEGATDADQVESLKVLNFSASNLMMLVNDILDFSKIEAGKVEFESVSFDLGELTSSIMHSHQLAAETKGLELEYIPSANLPNRLIGDPTRIGQVLNNLVSNAVKFTDHGWVQLSIENLGEENGQARMRFSVSDSGIGIPKDKHKEIFNNFSQAQGDTTRIFGGTGLGLAITKRLTELMDSEITLESAPGKGSKFAFEMLLELSADQSLEAKAQTNEEQQKLTGYRVLVAEDNEINTFVLQKFMEKWDLTAEYAVNGLEACEKVKDGRYDLVLMDLQMPEMDGYEATKTIRSMGTKEFANLPIVALTASAMIEIQDKAYAVGMNDYVSKPFNPDELYQKIAKYVRNKAA